MPIALPHRRKYHAGGYITNGLVGWWRCEEGTGALAADSSGNGNTLELENGVTWTTGKEGDYATEYDGTDQYGYVYASELALAGALTVCCWIRSDTSVSSAFETPIRKGRNYTFNWSNSSSTYRQAWTFEDDESDVYVLKYPGTLLANTWYHIAMTHDGGTSASIYLDGVFKLSISNIDSDLKSTGNPFLLGGGGDIVPPGRYFNGEVDDARVYNRALSEPELATIAALAG